MIQITEVRVSLRNDDKLKAFVQQTAGHARLICVDAANGYTKYFVDRVKQVRALCPWAVILAGNVATPEMVQELLISGEADIVVAGGGRQ
jgi:GMP reductase